MIEGDFKMDGIHTLGSEIECEFIKPGFSKDSLILSTGNATDILELYG